MSVKARVESTVSDTRKSLSKSAILQPNEPFPQVRTAIGVTYNVLSEVILDAVKCAQGNNGKLDPATCQKLVDSLYLSPRLPQWNYSDFANGYAQWRLYLNDDVTYVIVDNKPKASSITIVKGIRNYVMVKDDLVAATLFNSITAAQGLVAAISDKPMTEEEQAEYFAPDPDADCADIDSALADSDEQKSKDLFDGNPYLEQTRDDKELMEEALNEDQYREDDPAPIVTVSQKLIDDVSEGYEDKTTRRVAAEVGRVKEEYPEMKDAKGSGWDEVGTMAALGRGTIPRLKSLQGRILNIVEASLSDKEQRNAVKTLVNKEFRQEMNKVSGAQGWKDEE
jgi:hypothetical protein